MPRGSAQRGTSAPAHQEQKAAAGAAASGPRAARQFPAPPYAVDDDRPSRGSVPAGAPGGARASGAVQASRRPPPPPRSDWFSQLFGFAEGDYQAIQGCIQDGFLRVELDADSHGRQTARLISEVNHQVYDVGCFETLSLGRLRQRVKKAKCLQGRLRVSNELGDVALKHASPENKYATFQVASQFNCLEMVGPNVVPEEGVTGYFGDKTQGPACSIACGPATVYRNYFVPVVHPGIALAPGEEPPERSRVQLGQTSGLQIENLCKLSNEVGNEPPGRFFEVRNGYSLSSEGALRQLNVALKQKSRESLLQALRVGVHSDVQVTSCNWGSKQLRDPRQLVSQVFGSACAVAYNRSTSRESWAPLARLVLEASYEATLCAAALAASRHRGEEASTRVFLTCLGGGVFGNPMEWIVEAMRSACMRFRDFDLDVRIVTYSGGVDPLLLQLEREFSRR